jgi:hypothetical protein
MFGGVREWKRVSDSLGRPVSARVCIAAATHGESGIRSLCAISVSHMWPAVRVSVARGAIARAGTRTDQLDEVVHLNALEVRRQHDAVCHPTSQALEGARAAGGARDRSAHAHVTLLSPLFSARCLDTNMTKWTCNRSSALRHPHRWPHELRPVQAQQILAVLVLHDCAPTHEREPCRVPEYIRDKVRVWSHRLDGVYVVYGRGARQGRPLELERELEGHGVERDGRIVRGARQCVHVEVGPRELEAAQLAMDSLLMVRMRTDPGALWRAVAHSPSLCMSERCSEQ